MVLRYPESLGPSSVVFFATRIQREPRKMNVLSECLKTFLAIVDLKFDFTHL